MVFAGKLHSAKELAATQARVDQDARAPAGDNGAVPLQIQRQHREAHHGLSIARRAVLMVVFFFPGKRPAEQEARLQKALEADFLPYAVQKTGTIRCAGSCGLARLHAPAVLTMKRIRILSAIALGLAMAGSVRYFCVALPAATAHAADKASAAAADWDQQAAARYLDSRETWWQGWDHAKRDHDTVCVSCHTQVPYALARPELFPH